MLTPLTRRENAPISLILAAFILLGLTYSVVNPLYEATDELRHYRFVRYLVVNKTLPVQGVEPCRSQSHHPPLFYLLGAVATAAIDTGRDVCFTPTQNPFWNFRYWDVGVDNKSQYLHGADEAFPWHGDALAAHVARALNVLLGTVVVWLTWALGRLIWPRRPAIAAGGAALVAFNPMFLYMAGAINNDVIAAASGAALTLALARLLRAGTGLAPRRGVAIGALFALALLSKTNLVALALPIGAVVLWVAWQHGQWRAGRRRDLLLAGAALVGTTLLLSGWWFSRNLLVYGDPTGFRLVTELWGVRDPRESLPLALQELPYAWTTLWGRFGFGQIPLPETIYRSLRWFAGLSLLGWAVPALRRQWPRAQTLLLAHLLLTVLVVGGVWFNYMLVSPAGPMGRFFFPGLPALALLISGGLSQWPMLLRMASSSFCKQALLRSGSATNLQKRSAIALLRQARPGVADWLVNGAASLGLLTLALVALFAYLRPAYSRPPAWADADIPQPLFAQFDSLVILRGYGLDRAAAAPGEPLRLELYWEVIGQPPGDYLLFVHLRDEDGLMIAQRDTHPGLGRFPSSQWRPGDRFVDTVDLYLPDTAYTPDQGSLSVGLYAPGAYRLGISDGAGAFLGDALSLAAVAVTPLPGAVPNAQWQNFGDDLLLRGYAYETRALPAGAELSLTLYWEALRAAPDYHVRLELWDEQGQLWGRQQGAPAGGATSAWPAGAVRADGHRFPLAPDLPPGRYVLRLALVDPDTGRLQNIIAADGHWLADQLDLAAIRVTP